MATSEMSPPTQAAQGRIRDAAGTLLPLLLVVLGMGEATHSVVRYELRIVVVYTVLALLLALWLVAGRPTALVTGHPGLLPRTASTAVQYLGYAFAVTFLLVAVLHVTVRPYTYLTKHQGWVVRWIYAGSAVLVALVLLASVWLGRRRLVDAALAVAVVGYLVAAVLLIHLDAAPKIDVWVMLQQTADGLLHGKDMYQQNWSGSPGVQNAFTYLPLTGLLLAPGRWLFGDVRWALVTVTLLGVFAVRMLAVPALTPVPPLGTAKSDYDETGVDSAPGSASEAADSPRTASSLGVQAGAPSRAVLAAAGCAALLLLLPGTATQVEQAWTEPLLMACLAGWALGVHRRNTLLAVLCLALGMASKQHLIVLLPVLAAWPRFGLRKAAISGVLAFGFVLPWIIASPKDIWHDAVTTLVHFQPLRFADTLYIAAIHELHWTPPFWLTGAAVLATLIGAGLQVRRRNPDLGTVLRWSALFLFVANLVNKQAFYNQYWLVAALILISLAVHREEDGGADLPNSVGRSLNHETSMGGV